VTWKAKFPHSIAVPVFYYRFVRWGVYHISCVFYHYCVVLRNVSFAVVITKETRAEMRRLAMFAI